MPKQNLYLIKENYKKVEEVREIENKAPSLEEFMKTYESDKAVNYNDLTHSDISDKGKGYGPCPDGCDKTCETVISDNGKVVYASIGIVRFHLKIECFNWNGGGGTLYTDNIEG